MGQRPRPAVPHNAAVGENFLKLGGGGRALSSRQICLPAYVCRIETGNIATSRLDLSNELPFDTEVWANATEHNSSA
jgi:hypothetical protein